jgi:RNA polymerase sigma-70 factor (ECF subfamily)
MEHHRPEPPAGLASEASELWDVLGELPEDQRIAVVLRYYGGYKASEIATIVDMPGATVRSHLRRGLTALRKELDS